MSQIMSQERAALAHLKGLTQVECSIFKKDDVVFNQSHKTEETAGELAFTQFFNIYNVGIFL